jgi:SGNH domain (fused to AT3 domains)
VPATLVRSLRGLSSLPPIFRADFDRRQRLVLESLDEIKKVSSVLVFYPHAVLCNVERCTVADGALPLYSDDDHLSAFGAERVARVLAPQLIKLVRSPVVETGTTR